MKASTEEALYKVVWLVKFRQDMPREDVLRWWRGQHAAIAKETPGMVRYVQNHWIAPLDPATALPDHEREPVFDGHAEHRFESREAYELAMTSDAWQRTPTATAAANDVRALCQCAQA